jgi:diguanylate cyclase (GGDEF)-like protein
MAQPDDAAGGRPSQDGGRKEGALSRRRTEFQRRAQASLLLEVAISDPMLGCYKRVYLALRAREEVARRVRYGQRLSLLLLAADGGAEPEELRLKAIVAAANLALRPTDILARWQSGELVVLLPGTGLSGASRLARLLCAHVAASGLAVGSPLAASIGIATALGRQEGLELLIQRARSGLGEARLAGGGRVGIG